jgi:hypothetical protein
MASPPESSCSGMKYHMMRTRAPTDRMASPPSSYDSWNNPPAAVGTRGMAASRFPALIWRPSLVILS